LVSSIALSAKARREHSSHGSLCVARQRLASPSQTYGET